MPPPDPKVGATIFDFDTPVDRRNTASTKWDKYKGREVLPLWVADMDFRSPPAVTRALRDRADHAVFGYTGPPEELVEVVLARLAKRYGWNVERESLLWLPGLVTGLNVVCRAVGEDGDAVVTAVPVYPPFLTAPKNSRRELVTVPLARAGERWEFDLERFEASIAPSTRLFLLCNPHNPVGRAFTRAELEALAAVCERHDVVICSDEIHCDLILDPGATHTPIAALSPEVARRTITLMAPSKTFNLPGLGCSFAVIQNPDLRKRFRAAAAGIVPHVNILGFAAALAAYRDGGEWLAQLLSYLRGNLGAVLRAMPGMPGLAMSAPEATYLAWVDARGTGVENPARFFEEAGVGLSDGADFGGPGFVRLNFGCPRATLDEALSRMAKAVDSLRP